ncbi:hypothetical protein HY837_05500 [archaeon]|nr:hypothetical protein [archaeon]
MCNPNYGTKKTPRGHTTRLSKAKNLEVLVGDRTIKFPAVNVSKDVVEVFMQNAYEGRYSKGYCAMTFFKGKKVRLIDFSSDVDGVITVAGYWKGYFFPGKEEYELSPTDNRWETLQLIPQEEREELEKQLKNMYATVNFW